MPRDKILIYAHSERQAYFFNFFFCILFVFFDCTASSLLCGLSLVMASKGYSSLQCTDFSLWCHLLLWSTGSRYSGFSSCITQVQQFHICAELLHGIWHLPGPGIELVSPALAGRFSTVVPPGKSTILPFILLVPSFFVS